jgi:glycosyltransferase involved in cell wall biosynthesis
MMPLVAEAKNAPLVSVVIPTSNRANLLKRALESVLSQTYRKLEILVIDDASRDNTRAVVEAFKDDRIRYLRHDINLGGSAARNSGIRAAKGHFIAFLDDDDEWVPEKTQKQLTMFSRFDAVLCTCYKNGRSMGKWFAREIVRLEDLRRNPYSVGGTGVLMAKSKILKNLLFDESLPLYQDWDLFIRLAHRCDIGYLNAPLLVYNEGDHQRITNRRASLTANEMEKQAAMLHKHKGFFGPKWYKRHLAGLLLYGFFRHRRNKMPYLRYVIERCGISAVARAITKRVQRKLIEAAIQAVRAGNGR